MTRIKKHCLTGVLALAWGLTGVGAASAAFGAIAFSPQTGAHGYSYGAASRAQAERLAMSHCRANGSGCRIMVYFQNACGSLAVGRGNGYGYAWAPSRAQAEARAMRACRNNTSSCRIVSWSCSG